MVHRRDRVHSCHRAPVILGPAELGYLAAIGSTVRTAAANDLRESTTLGYPTQSGWQRVLVSSDLPVVHEEGVEEGTWKNRERRGVEGIRAEGENFLKCGRGTQGSRGRFGFGCRQDSPRFREDRSSPPSTSRSVWIRWESYRSERGFFTLAFPVSTVCLGPVE